ncbi:cysteine desulfurase [Sneathiella marina]|uniref:Cysteine desulfurase n=1 Tax=Sneathiella marina TaxID=2950108 RepID=A0ABY4W5F1_9PROT|nr:cysteine desulfurase family protein [Sneathiella marina]USG62268.1 cysteine desulfurase [Sneathiella marina]
MTPRSILHKGERVTLPLYLDYQASTPLDPKVRQQMAPYLDTHWGNPHSSTHGFGHDARKAIAGARQQIAGLLGADPQEIIFTSGATEANNLALLGHVRSHVGARHVISVETEHEAVLAPLSQLEAEGVAVTRLPVDARGGLDLDQLKQALRPETVLVSVMMANNETGACADLEAIGRICRGAGVTFHSDAAQGLGTKELDVRQTAVDLVSLSGHKIYGPMGIGALYQRGGCALTPLVHGGAQEKGLRAGTLPTALCVGLGAACALLADRREADAERILALRQQLVTGLKSALGEAVQVNEDAARQNPGCLSLRFDGIEAEDLLHALPDLALATGSACTSRDARPSHVLLAMGQTAVTAASTLRLGIGRETTAAEISYVRDQLVAAYPNLSG